VPLEQVTVEASGHLHSLCAEFHRRTANLNSSRDVRGTCVCAHAHQWRAWVEEDQEVESARNKLAEVSRWIDQTHRQFRHDVIWSGTR
jgi:hypothetical protein